MEWSIPTNGFVSYGLDAGDNVVYFGSRDGKLYAVDMYSGTARWSVSLETQNHSEVHSPVLDNGLIYVGVGDNSIYAVDPASGNIRWHFDQMEGAAVSKPLCKLGYVYAGSGTDVSMPWTRTAGSWSGSTRTGGSIKATPLFDASSQAPIIYSGSEDGNMYAIDAEFGRPYWRYKASGTIDTTPIVIAGSDGVSHLYFVSFNGDVYSLKLPSGNW